MKDYIRQLIESLVKDPARGVPKGTNLKITYRAGEKLDRAMKYFDDFGSQRKKIQKLMHSAEMDKDGNLVITPKSTQGAKKIRSIMQDVLAPRKDETKQETNENLVPGKPLGDHTASEIARDATNQPIDKYAKFLDTWEKKYAKKHNLTPEQIAAIRSAVGGKAKRFDRGGGHALAKILRRKIQNRQQ